MRKLTRNSVRQLRFASYDWAFPQRGYVCLGESGWPCALRKKEFEQADQRKENATYGNVRSRLLSRQSGEGAAS